MNRDLPTTYVQVEGVMCLHKTPKGHRTGSNRTGAKLPCNRQLPKILIPRTWVNRDERGPMHISAHDTPSANHDNC